MKVFPSIGLCLLMFGTSAEGATLIRPRIDWVTAFTTDSRELVVGMGNGSTDILYLGSSLPAGDLQIGNSVVSSNGSGSHEIVSVSPAGDGLNSFRATSGAIYPHVVSVDRTGNVVAAGNHIGTTVLGSRTLNENDSDFVGLMAPDGTWLNGGSFNRPFNSVALGVTADASRNIYVCGDLRNGSTFGTSTVNIFTGGGESRGYVAKLTAGGGWEWVLYLDHTGSFSPFSGSRIRDVAIDSESNVVILGETPDTASFAGIPLGDGSRSFLAQISAAGALRWIRTFAADQVRALHTDHLGRIHVAGHSPNSIPDLDPLVSAINTNRADFYVARMDSAGQFEWGRPGYESASTKTLDVITTDKGGHIYLGGNVSGGSITFGTDTITGDTFGGFVAAMDAAGAWLWAVELPSTESGLGVGGVNTPVYLAGTGSNSVYFGRSFKSNPVTIGNSTFTNSTSSTDVYFGRISTVVSNVDLRPVILEHPLPAKTVAGGTATFSVVASGTNTQYQWLRDGSPLHPANGPSVFMVQLTRANQGDYSVQVWNEHGTNTSNAARLRVLSPVQLGQLEKDALVRLGFSFFDPAGFQFMTNDVSYFEIQVSTNLSHWEPVTNEVTWADGAFQFTDPASTNSGTRFYRTREQ